MPLALGLTGLPRGPLISPAAKERVIGLISSAEQEGGEICLDGRRIEVPDYPQGNFVGPTIIEANTNMKCYRCVSFLHPDVSSITFVKGGDFRTRPCGVEGRHPG